MVRKKLSSSSNKWHQRYNDGESQKPKTFFNFSKIYVFLALLIVLYGCTAIKEVPKNVTINPLSVTCPVPSAQVGIPYGSAIVASGGTGNYQFLFTGKMPPGLVANGQVLSGSPMINSMDNYSFTVQVTDSSNNTQSEICSIDVTQILYQCSLTKAVYLTQPMCYQACLGLQDDCQIFVPVPKTIPNPINILLGVGAVGGILIAVFLFVFRDALTLFFFPETDRLKLRVPVTFPLTGRKYNLFDNVSYDEEGNVELVVTHTKRLDDRHQLSSRDYALNLLAGIKFGAHPVLIRFDEKVRKAEADIEVLRTENASLRQWQLEFMGKDVLGAMKTWSFTAGEIAKDLHPVVPTFNAKRDGQNFGFEGQSQGGD